MGWWVRSSLICADGYSGMLVSVSCCIMRILLSTSSYHALPPLLSYHEYIKQYKVWNFGICDFVFEIQEVLAYIWFQVHIEAKNVFWCLPIISQLSRISSSRFTFANLPYKYGICYSNGTHLPKEFHARMLLYTSNSQQILVVYASYCCFLMAHIVMSHCHVTVGHMMKFFGILKPLMKMTSHITWEHRLMIFKAPQHVHTASPFLCLLDRAPQHVHIPPLHRHFVWE